MAHFKHTFKVLAPLSAVWLLHEDPKALKDLTPPPVRVKIISMEQPLHAGSNLIFRLYLFEPFGATWHAVYDEFEPYEPGKTVCHFVDRSLSGPFRFWVHRHMLSAVNEKVSTITDDVTFRLFGGPIGAIITWLVAWPAIAFLFFYRRLKSRQVLKKIVLTGRYD